MPSDFMNAKTLCHAVQGIANMDLTPRPFNRFDPDVSLWWLVPSTEWPAFKYGKLFTTDPALAKTWPSNGSKGSRTSNRKRRRLRERSSARLCCITDGAEKGQAPIAGLKGTVLPTVFIIQRTEAWQPLTSENWKGFFPA